MSFIEELKELEALKASGALTDDEYAAAKARVLNQDNKNFNNSAQNGVIIPEIVDEGVRDEKLDEKYAKNYSEEGFWDKITSVIKKAGTEVIYKALQLFYATQNPGCPVAIKATIYAALGYFILPLDVIPDFIPGAGFTDDLLAIGAALAMAHLYIDDCVILRAKEKMCDLFGNGILKEL